MSQDPAKKPSVVGVIPAHNHARWVAGAVRSLARQTYPPAGIVVVDDGSTDGTFGELLQSLSAYAGSFADVSRPVGGMDGVSVHYIRHDQPKGPAAARNAGAALATRLYSPDLFAFLDSDDEYHPEKVEKSVRVFTKVPEVALVYTDYDTLAGDGSRQRAWKEVYSQRRMLAECLPNADSLISRAAFEWAGGFPEFNRVCEDLALWLRLSTRYVMYHVAESLLTVRIGEHSSSSTVPKSVWEASYRRAYEWAGYA